MRVGIVALLHESNTFIRDCTRWEDFASDVLVEGPTVRDVFAGTHHEVGGFFAELEESYVTAVPVFAARAVPYGPIADAALRRLLDRIIQLVCAAERIDGWLVAVHGAAASQSDPDVDGTVLTLIRQLIGERPMIATLDAHANLSPRMVAACDALVPYRSNPHVDQYERGREAAALLIRTLREEITPVTVAAPLRLVINIERQCTDEDHWRSIHEFFGELRRRPGILTAAPLLGFPYCDVPKMGSSLVVTADASGRLAQDAVRQAALTLWNHRHHFLGGGLSIEETLNRLRVLQPPVCLLDMGDNVGGGSPGDGTVLASALLEHRFRAFVCLYDPAAVMECSRYQPGEALELSVGGKSDRQYGEPIQGRFQLRGLFDGRFQEDQPRHGGIRQYDQGKTAIVEHPSGLTVMLTSRRVPPFSLRQLTAFGIDPREFHAIVAKGVNAPLAAYRSVCRNYLRVDTPGVTTANLSRLPFQRRRRPLFPWEDVSHTDPWDSFCMGHSCNLASACR